MFMSLRAVCVALAASSVPTLAFAQSQASFTSIGFLNIIDRQSYAWGVSADGLSVVGESSSLLSGLQSEAFTWKRDAGIRGIGGLEPENLFSVANATSASGGVIVGFSRYALVGTLFQAFRDTDSNITSVDALSDLPEGALLSNAQAVSDDGNVVVGFGHAPDAQGASRQRAFIYDAVNDQMRPLGLLPGDNTSNALAISADGSHAAGHSSFAATSRAVHWIINPDGHVITLPLPELPGGADFAEAWGISGNGAVIVGDSESESGVEACKWISGIVSPLGDLPGGDFNSSAYDASDDASIIVGYGSSASSGFSGEAAYWDSAGIHSIKDTLIAAGVDLTGWQLHVATAVSADGRTIIGNGINPAGNPEGWVVVLPPPCRADFNADGFVNPDDLSDFITCFFLDVLFPDTCPAADLNADGFRDPDDLSDFITLFFTTNC